MNRLRRVRRVLAQRLRTAASTLPGPFKGPRISVVVVARGEAPFLDACLSSVLAATHRNLEVLLVSETGAHESNLGPFDGDSRIRVMEPPQEQSPIDWAAAQCTGDFVSFVDADDLVSPRGYEQLLAVLKETGSDFAVGQHFRHESGRFREVPWSAAQLAGRSLRTTAADVPRAMVDSSHGNRLISTEFWRRVGLDFGDAGLCTAPTVMTEAYLSARSFDIVPVRTYDECVRDGARPILEQRRYQSADLRRRLDVLLTSAAVVRERAGTDAYVGWLVTVLDSLLPPLYRDGAVAGEGYGMALAGYVRELLGSSPSPELLSAVPVASRVSAWLAANSGPVDLSLMVEHVAANPHGLPTCVADSPSDGVEIVIPDGIKTAVPTTVRRVQPVDLIVRTRLTRVEVNGSTLEIDGAAFLEYEPGAASPRVELVNHANGDRRLLPTRARPDPGINIWSGRAWEDHSRAGFTSRLDLDELVSASGDEPGAWMLEITLEGRRAGKPVPFQSRSSHTLGVATSYRSDRGQVLVRWDDYRGLELVREGTRSSIGHTNQAAATPDLVVDSVSIVHDGLLLSGQSRISDATQWQLAGPRAVGTVTESTSEQGRFAATLDLTHSAWGRDRVPLPTGRYRIKVESAGGSDVLIEWGHGAKTGFFEDLMTERQRVEVLPQPQRTADLVVLPPVSGDARGAYGQNLLRTRTYVDARRQARSDTVLFESFGGRSAGDNPGAICTELVHRDLGLDLVWVVDDPSVVVPVGTRAVARRSPDWYTLMATARGYVSNAGAPYFFRKRHDQFHLQTWHGTPLKRIGEDRPPDGFEIWRHNRQIRAQAARWDTLLSQSPFCSDALRGAFEYGGRMLECGYPRNDVLLSEDAPSIRARVRATLGLEEEERVVLYAPTWRDYAGAKEAKPLYLDADLVARQLPDTVVLVRGHYSGSNEDDAYSGQSRVLDVTRYPEIADLFLAADVLVTDYSSVMFDFALTDKPIILLVPDLEQYRDVERGFYFDIEAQAPGPMVRTTMDAVEALTAEDGFVSSRHRFRSTYCAFEDGHASARVVDDLLDHW